MITRIFAQNEADVALAEKVIAELSEFATVQINGSYIIVRAGASEVQRWVKSFPDGWALIDPSLTIWCPGESGLGANISAQLFQAARRVAL